MISVIETAPERSQLDVVEPSRCCWPKPDSIPERVSGRSTAARIIERMSLDFAECDRARLARDAAYDGLFYTGVHTTGIYCRPVCPVRPPRPPPPPPRRPPPPPPPSPRRAPPCTRTPPSASCRPR